MVRPEVSADVDSHSAPRWSEQYVVDADANPAVVLRDAKSGPGLRERIGQVAPVVAENAALHGRIEVARNEERRCLAGDALIDPFPGKVRFDVAQRAVLTELIHVERHQPLESLARRFQVEIRELDDAKRELERVASDEPRASDARAGLLHDFQGSTVHHACVADREATQETEPVDVMVVPPGDAASLLGKGRPAFLEGDDIGPPLLE